MYSIINTGWHLMRQAICSKPSSAGELRKYNTGYKQDILVFNLTNEAMSSMITVAFQSSLGYVWPVTTTEELDISSRKACAYEHTAYERPGLSNIEPFMDPAVHNVITMGSLANVAAVIW